MEFTLAGQRFTALNGGPEYSFTPAVSFVVDCDTQEEVDHYWDQLSEGGDRRKPSSAAGSRTGSASRGRSCRRQLCEYMSDPDPEKAGRTMQAMLQMKKLDIDGLRRAHDGE